MNQLPKKQIPERFKDIAAHLGIGIQHFIKTYAIRDDYLGQHKRGEIELSDEWTKTILTFENTTSY